MEIFIHPTGRRRISSMIRLQQTRSSASSLSVEPPGIPARWTAMRLSIVPSNFDLGEVADPAQRRLRCASAAAERPRDFGPRLRRRVGIFKMLVQRRTMASIFRLVVKPRCDDAESVADGPGAAARSSRPIVKRWHGELSVERPVPARRIRRCSPPHRRALPRRGLRRWISSMKNTSPAGYRSSSAGQIAHAFQDRSGGQSGD